MPDNIAGYIDRSYVKGSTYKYAADPIPTVFTGDIDNVSEDLLVKAMLVINNGSNGTFPAATSGTYLIRTIEFGNAILLQSAVDFATGIEYRRINSNGAWTDWVSSNDEVADIRNNVTLLRTDVDKNTSSINGLNSKINGDGTQENPGISNQIASIKSDVNGHETRIKSLENKTLSSQTSTNILDCLTASSFSKCNITSCYFSRIGAICSLTIALKTKVSISSGSNILSAAPGTLVNSYYPPYTVYGSGYYGNNPIPMALTNPIGNRTIIIRNAGSDAISSGATMATNVMWTYSEGGEE